MTYDELAKVFLDHCIKNNLIPAHKISQAQMIADVSDRDIYELLLDTQLLNIDLLNELLSKITGYPFLDPLYESIHKPYAKETLYTLSHKLAFENMIFPIKIEEGSLHLAMANPTDEQVVRTVEAVAKYPVKRYVCYFKNIMRAVVRFYTYLGGKTFEVIVTDALDEVSGKKKIEAPPSIWNEPIAKAMTREIRLFSGQQDPPREGEVAISLLVQKIINNAIYLGVSDIHIEPFEEVIKVRFRKDGVLFAQWYIPIRLQSNLVNRLKVMANMDPTAHSKPQGGYISYENIVIVGVDIRASTVPTMYGERFAMRLLDKSRTLLNPADLGLNENELKLFATKIKSPQGLILMTGPTGSGKTTTIYAALDQLNRESSSIITIEDPIEYQMLGISQIQIKPKQELGFAEVFREVLRQDPDVILLGEIRDSDSAKVAVTASSTGHLVFSTLHTNNAASSIPRLISMGTDSFVLSDTLELIIAQRLVRRLCPHCKKEDELHEDRLKELGLDAKELKDGNFFAPQGCKQCNFTGYISRIGVFELLNPNEQIREMIIHKEPSLHIERQAQESGMVNMRQDAMDKARKGIVSLDEVIRVTSSS